MTNLRSLCVALPLAFVLPACGGGSKAADAKSAAKKAADAKKKEQEDALAKRKAAREAKEREKEEAEKKHQEAIAAVCVLPEKLPKNLDKACKAVTTAQSAFVEKHYDGKALERLKSADATQIPLTIKQCKQSGSLKVAACQRHAFETAGPELKKAIPDFFRICAEKFGGDDSKG